MSGPVSTAGLGTSTKLIGLTKHTKHGHVPSPVSPHFVAPPAQPALSFNSIALAAAIARTATTWDDAPGISVTVHLICGGAWPPFIRSRYLA